MAAAPQKQALDVIKSKVLHVNERYDGYRTDLMAALHDILVLENDKPHNIAQQVTRRVAALGELLNEKEGNIE